MKTSNMAFCVAILVASSSAMVCADDPSDRLEQLKALTREIQLLRTQVERLEQRVQELENVDSLRDMTKTPWSFPQEVDLKTFRFTTRRHIDLGPPLNYDTGLYVFPGLDAPPLSPADVPR